MTAWTRRPPPTVLRLPLRLPNLTRLGSAFTIVFIAAYAISTGAEARKHPKNNPVTKARTAVAQPLYAQRPDAMQAADAIAQQTGLDAAWVRQTIGQARLVPSIVKAVAPPAVGTAKNWSAYRSRFVEPRRIQAGVVFWQTHRAALERAEQVYGVPAAIIVGIIGVETLYGKQMGRYRVLDALCTLAFDFPETHPKAQQRAAFFRSELEALLVLTQRQQIDPLILHGSYAGAMGLPQFMPSSWSKYALDFDGDDRIDLFHSAADVIGSVAHYFKVFGWKPGMPTHYPVQLQAQGDAKAALLAPDIVPTFSVQTLLGQGAMVQGPALLHEGPLAVVELQDGNNPAHYVVGTENFFALTRYNWSSYYALAVIELGQAVQDALPQ